MHPPWLGLPGRPGSAADQPCRVQWLAARAGLVDTQAWRVNLREFHPVGRFGASLYTRCSDRFEMAEASSASAPIDQL